MCFDRSDRKWLYKAVNFKEGDVVSGGDVFGCVYENELIPEHWIMCPPNVKGTVVRVYGSETDDKEELTLRAYEAVVFKF